jgi:hypothetical protein
MLYFRLLSQNDFTNGALLFAAAKMRDKKGSTTERPLSVEDQAGRPGTGLVPLVLVNTIVLLNTGER